MTTNAMTGVILAAGTGTRLRQSWPDTPKPLVPVCGEPMIGRLLRILDRAELDSLVVVSRATDPAVGRYVRGLGLGTHTISIECVTSGTLQSLIAGLGAVSTDCVLLALADTVFPEEELVRFRRSARSMDVPQATGIQWVRRRRSDDSAGEQGVRILPGGLITGIGRDLTAEPIISQGMSLLNRPLFELAHEAAASGATGLSDFLPFAVRKDGVALYAHRCDRIRDVDSELDRRTVEQQFC